MTDLRELAERANSAWRRYAADFAAMTDEQIEYERQTAQALVDENEEWLEAVASWERAGKPRTKAEQAAALRAIASQKEMG